MALVRHVDVPLWHASLPVLAPRGGREYWKARDARPLALARADLFSLFEFLLMALTPNRRALVDAVTGDPSNRDAAQAAARHLV